MRSAQKRPPRCSARSAKSRSVLVSSSLGPLGPFASVDLTDFAILADLILVNDIGFEQIRLRQRHRIGILMAGSYHGSIHRSLWCLTDGNIGCTGRRVNGPTAA